MGIYLCAIRGPALPTKLCGILFSIYMHCAAKNDSTEERSNFFLKYDLIKFTSILKFKVLIIFGHDEKFS